MPSRTAQAWNANARNANTVPLVPDKEVKMQNFRKPIQLLVKSMTNQNNQQVLVPTNRIDRSMETRVCDFVSMNLHMFLGSKVSKDPQKFIDEVKKIFDVMSITVSYM